MRRTNTLQNATTRPSSVVTPLAVVRADTVPNVWKTITLGEFANSHALHNALDAADCGIGDLAEEALTRPAFNLASTKTGVRLRILP